MENSTREQLIAWGFLAPALIILAAFGLFPIGYAFYVSLHQWQIRRGGLIGFDHYVEALGQPHFIAYVVLGLLAIWAAQRVWKGWGLKGAAAKAVGLALIAPALWLLIKGVPGLLDTGDFRLYNGFRVTFFYALYTIPVELTCAMALAYLLFKSLRGQGVFRVLFFLPYVTPVIASAVVFRTLFNPHPSALANRFWSWLGFENQRWLYEHKTVVRLMAEAMEIGHYPSWIDEFFPSMALVSIVVYNIWVYIGYDTVILLAGLSAIPRHYYEAAEIDGAGSWQMFRNITLPLVSNEALIFRNMLAGIGTFRAFNHIYIMRYARGPGNGRRDQHFGGRADLPVPQRRIRRGPGLYPICGYPGRDPGAE